MEQMNRAIGEQLASSLEQVPVRAWGACVLDQGAELSAQVVCVVHSGIASKYSPKTPRPKGARVLGDKLHACYMKVSMPTENRLDPGSGYIGTQTLILLRFNALQGNKILRSCTVKITHTVAGFSPIEYVIEYAFVRDKILRRSLLQEIPVEADRVRARSQKFIDDQVNR
ncbi:hypothetical protein VNO80_01368 [Phaseolus coccineus]|uniref:Uncharacterized protein n=1 Tax=Phaseolus coccineus TaxID=3886 RepID=A0AAN9RSR6_PHACN